MLKWDDKLRIMAQYFNVGESEMTHRCIEFRYSCLQVTDSFNEHLELMKWYDKEFENEDK